MRLNKNVLPTALITMGTLHFLRAKTFESIVPPRLPGSPRLYNFASGAWEIATGYLLTDRATRESGGASAAALFLAVWPANMYHAWIERDARWPKKLYHIIRLPLQIPLIRYAWKIAQGRA